MITNKKKTSVFGERSVALRRELLMDLRNSMTKNAKKKKYVSDEKKKGGEGKEIRKRGGEARWVKKWWVRLGSHQESEGEKEKYNCSKLEKKGSEKCWIICDFYSTVPSE